MNNNLELTWVSLLALLVALVAMFTAFWRAKQTPALAMNREQALEQRVAELEKRGAELQNTVATLQGLLYEKTQQNGKLIEEIAMLNNRVRDLEKMVPASPTRVAYSKTLLAVIGEDPALKIDLSALREVEHESELRVSRVYPVTKAKLKSVLDRYRVNGKPVKYVHMAVHAGPNGLVFQGELVDSQWLSDNLKSVEVLVVNGCESDQVGDWIGVVNNVVTMREAITHEDAAQFAKLFWLNIAAGMSAEDAYYAARERSPQPVAEFVELN